MGAETPGFHPEGVEVGIDVALPDERAVDIRRETKTPYDYQYECLDALETVREEGSERALVVMATGLGKTFVAAHDVKRHLEEWGGSALYLCHQNDILGQARETFEDVLGSKYTYGYFHGQEREMDEVDVLFASFQTMQNWREEFHPEEFDYVVVDESHHGPAPTYVPTIEHFKPLFLLGITATPNRSDLQDIREIFGPERYSLPLEEALARGLLTNVDYRLITDDIQDEELLDTPVGKVSVRELNRKLFVPKRDEEIVRIIEERLEGIENPRTIIFCPSIEYTERLTEFLPGAAPLHSALPQDLQRRRMEAFRDGRVHTVLTVDKFNEGIDIPDANALVFLRSTQSRTVFLQQLGRGLRQSPTKEQVLVLDFVANLERIEMIDRLWKDVEAEYESLHPERVEDNLLEGPMNIEVGSVQFNEVSKRLLDVVEAIRAGYTREVLIGQLQVQAERLGRAPTQVDLNAASKEGETATYGTFKRYFGSYGRALEEAGLEANLTFYENDQIIEELQALGQELGRTPKKADIDEANRQGRIASTTTIRGRFGSYNAALELAGMRPNQVVRTEEQMIEDLRTLADDLGRIPTGKELRVIAKERGMASETTLALRFGSYRAALEAAGLELPQGPSREDVISDIQRLHEELGRPPGYADLAKASKHGKAHSYAVVRRHFKTFSDAVRAAGFRPLAEKLSDDEAISRLQAFGQELGRKPSSKDIDEARRQGHFVPSVSLLGKKFGSLTKALEVAGYETPRREYTDEDLVTELTTLTNELGRVPTGKDVQERYESGEGPSKYLFQRRFGSFKAALKAAGLPETERYTDQQMLDRLKRLAEELGHSPSVEELNEAAEAGKVPWYSAYTKRFGTRKAAFEAAGVPEPERHVPKQRYSDDDLRGQLRQLASDFGRAPSSEDIAAARKRGMRIAAKQTFTLRFGSMAEARKAAGLSD